MGGRLIRFNKTGTLKLLLAVIFSILVIVGVYFSMPKIVQFVGFVIKLFLPFIFGYLFSLLVNPLADFLQKKLKLPRGLSAVLVIILTVGVLGSIITFGIYKLIDEIRNLYVQFPILYENAQASFHELSAKWGVVYANLPENIQAVFTNIFEDISIKIANAINNKSSPIVEYAGGFAKSLPSIFIGVIVFILSSFFMVSDPENTSKMVHRLLPKKTHERFHLLGMEIQKYLGGYVKAQCIIMSIAFVIIFTGLTILGVDYALLIALGIAVFDALPFFGSGAILWPWAIISFINAEYKVGVGLIIVYFAVLFTRQMIEPKIVSQNIGMPPLATLMSMHIGYRVFSVGGLILGPLVMMLCVSLYKANIFEKPIQWGKNIVNYFKKEFKNLHDTFFPSEQENEESSDK